MSDRTGWDGLEDSVERGPIRATIRIALIVLVGAVFITAAGWLFGFFGKAASEFGAGSALEKYEWFIETAEDVRQLDAQITLFENRKKGIKERYQDSYGEDVSLWPPVTALQYQRELQTASDDLVAIISQRNDLVANYNAQSNKFNWAPFRTRSDKPDELLTEYQTE